MDHLLVTEVLLLIVIRNIIAWPRVSTSSIDRSFSATDWPRCEFRLPHLVRELAIGWASARWHLTQEVIDYLMYRWFRSIPSRDSTANPWSNLLLDFSRARRDSSDVSKPFPCPYMSAITILEVHVPCSTNRVILPSTPILVCELRDSGVGKGFVSKREDTSARSCWN